MAPSGLVVEIGAGTGELTAALLDRGNEVVAVEVEDRLVTHLQERFASRPGLRIIQADARTMSLAELLPPNRPFTVAGNLPYFAASPIIRHVLEGSPRPSELVVMVQREVAHRIAAKPGKLSILGLAVQVYAEPTLLFDVPPIAFDPPPAVYSTVIRLVLRQAPLVPAWRIAAFFELVTRTFKNPRKHLHNALRAGIALPPGGAAEALEAAGIDPMRRPETLTIAEWLALLDATEARRAHAS